MTRLRNNILLGALVGLLVAALGTLRGQAAQGNPETTPTLAQIEKALTKIQRKGNAYYRYDGRADNANWLGTDYAVPNMYRVLKKNAPGSCTNTAALKVRMIEGEPLLSGLKPLVANFKAGPVYHVVVVVEKPGGGYWWLGNESNWLKEYSSLDGLPELEVHPLELWQQWSKFSWVDNETVEGIEE